MKNDYQRMTAGMRTRMYAYQRAVTMLCPALTEQGTLNAAGTRERIRAIQVYGDAAREEISRWKAKAGGRLYHGDQFELESMLVKIYATGDALLAAILEKSSHST